MHAREELGVDPDDLPSPWVAAGSSFAAFALGALVPVLPYLLGADRLLAAVCCAGVALFVAGALVSRFTDRSALYTGLRQLLLGGARPRLTYVVGSAVGAGGLTGDGSSTAPGGDRGDSAREPQLDRHPAALAAHLDRAAVHLDERRTTYRPMPRPSRLRVAPAVGLRERLEQPRARPPASASCPRC